MYYDLQEEYNPIKTEGYACKRKIGHVILHTSHFMTELRKLLLHLGPAALRIDFPVFRNSFWRQGIAEIPEDFTSLHSQARV